MNFEMIKKTAFGGFFAGFLGGMLKLGKKNINHFYFNYYLKKIYKINYILYIF